jgi:hypothetical protein
LTSPLDQIASRCWRSRSEFQPLSGRHLGQNWNGKSSRLTRPDLRPKRLRSQASPAVQISTSIDWHNFLLDPHPKMPNLSLTRTEATDLAAYIAQRFELAVDITEGEGET